MENRCTECGYRNDSYAAKCSKCGASLEGILKDQRRGMLDVRVFSIIYIITAAIGTADFIYRYSAAGQVTYGYFSSVPSLTSAQFESTVLPYLYIFEILAAFSAIVTLVSMFFLRSGFKTLYSHDKEFSTPLTGITLIFVGLIIVAIGAFVLVALLLSMLPGLLQSPPTYSIGSITTLVGVGLIVVLGAILLFIGVILGLLIGFHRLAVKFDDGLFDAAWVLYIISFFFAPIGLVAAYLSYAASNRTVRRIDEASTKV